MTEKENKTQFIKKPIVKIAIRFILALFILFLLLFVAIQIPAVQTKLIQKVSNYLSEKTGFKTKVSYVNIKWFDTILLEDVEIRDTKDSLMIGVHEVSLDYDIRSVLFDEYPHIDEATLDQATVRILKNTDEGGFNINLFVKNIKNLSKTKNKKKPFVIDKIYLKSSSFRLLDPTKDSIHNSFDYYHFDLVNMNAEVSDFKVIADTTLMNIISMTATEPIQNFKVDNLKTLFSISGKSMSFKELKLEAGKSVIQDLVVFNYDNMKQLSYFNDSVRIAAKLDQSIIHTNDLAVFAPSLKNYNDVYKFSGKIIGKVSSLKIRDLDFQFGDLSQFTGKLNIDGLPNFQESFIDLSLKNSVITPNDLMTYVKSNALNQLTRLGQVDFSGQFLGFPYDFVANGSFFTEYGRFDSDINLKIDAENKTSAYSGSMTTHDFEFGNLINRPELVQNINLTGNIKGTGLTLQTADFELDATIANIGVRDYIYENITTNARFTNAFFSGKLAINDKNLKFNGDAAIDFRENRQSIKLNARLDTLMIQPLKILSEEAFLSTTLAMDMQGTEINELVGEASFSNTNLEYKGKKLYLDTLYISSIKEENHRELIINSKEFNTKTIGNFELTTLYADLLRQYEEYKLNFQNNKELTTNYYKRKKKQKTYDKYKVTFESTLKNINPILQLFDKSSYISKNSKIEGDFTSGYTSILNWYAHADTVTYSGTRFFNNDIEISASKIADSTSVLAMAYIFSDKQLYKSFTTTDNLSIDAVWNKDKIDFTSSVSQSENDNYADLSGALNFLNDKIEVKFNPSDFRVIDKIWQIGANNKISFAHNNIYFDSVNIHHDNQSILVNGIVSKDKSEKLKIVANNFKIDNLNPLLSEELEGTVNGYAEIQNLYNTPIINSQLKVDEFKVNKFLVGNIYGTAGWEEKNNRLRVDSEIERTGKKIVDVRGYIYANKKEEQLDLVANFDQAQLGVIEPFLDDYISQLKGEASGKFSVTGKLDSPIFHGKGKLKDGEIKINYLNTVYSFNGDIVLDDNEIGFRSLILVDDNLQKAWLTGGLFHDGFKNFIVDLNGSMRNFKVLDTNAKLNDLYYGTGIVTGDLEIIGSFDNLIINADATTNKGTKFHIPLGGTEEIKQLDFIRFTKPVDSAALTPEIESVNIKRLTFNFDLDITPDAYAEIIFDIKSGDIIRGWGNGKLKFNIDPKGDFNMFGNLEIERGFYNFTLKNLINKEFTIVPKSKINWYGDPYGGILDIAAYYEQTASLASLAEPEQLSNPDIKRRYPAKVMLGLKGDLMNPDIDFDINFDAFPFSLSNITANLQSKLASDEQELSRQVFSLILLKKFSPQGKLDLGGTDAIGSSVSELFSNQLSYLLTQIDENLEIDVDINRLDDEGFNIFQLRLSYSFLNGRLRVTRDGAFTSGYEQENALTGIAGDWTVEYLLTPDGKLKAKMYNKTNYYLQEANTTAGFSIQYTENFDGLKDLMQRNRKKNKQKESDNEETSSSKENSKAIVEDN